MKDIRERERERKERDDDRRKVEERYLERFDEGEKGGSEKERDK